MSIWKDKAGNRFYVGVKVDQDKLVNRLWDRALKNKSGRATAMGGAITVEIKPVRAE